MHIPVLLNEVLEHLDPKPGKFIIDGTVNGGGHAREIIKRITPVGTFLGIDWDENILASTKEKFDAEGNNKNAAIFLKQGNYADLPEILQKMNLPLADGLLLDLGFSSEQLEGSGKGFSFMKDEELLMTYDANETPVKKILREVTDRDLAKIIFAYSGEKFAMRIAKAIKERGKKKVIETTGELVEIIKAAVPGNYEKGRINPATRTFQALRIYANHELTNLKKTIEKLNQILKPGGKVAIISFHSLEDRIAKQEFKELAKKEIFNITTKKPIKPSEEEITRNPRSRSAKLRAGTVVPAEHI